MTEKESIKQLKRLLDVKGYKYAEQQLKVIISTYKEVNENQSIKITKKVEDKYNLSKKLFVSVLPDEIVNDRDRFYYDVALGFYERIKGNLQNLGVSTRVLDKNTYKSWVDPIRLMMEQDDIRRDELSEVWKFLDNHEFWASNIQCTKTLRKQFSKLHAQYKSNGRKENNRVSHTDTSNLEARLFSS